MSRNAGFATASSAQPSTAVVSRSARDARQERQGLVRTLNLNRRSAADLETDDDTGHPPLRSGSQRSRRARWRKLGARDLAGDEHVQEYALLRQTAGQREQAGITSAGGEGYANLLHHLHHLRHLF